MQFAAVAERAKTEGWTDEEISSRVLGGETELYEIIMRRYNQRLYRIARAILRDDAEAEDVMQAAYVRAYEHLGQFAGRAAFAAWLTKIAVHESLARLNNRNRTEELESMFPGEAASALVAVGDSPEQQAADSEIRHVLEDAILSLPEDYRTIVMLRDIEEMSTADRSEEHTSELQSRRDLVCRLLLEKKKKHHTADTPTKKKKKKAKKPQ